MKQFLTCSCFFAISVIPVSAQIADCAVPVIETETYALYSDRVEQVGGSRAIVVSPTRISSTYPGIQEWNLKNDIGSYPQLGTPWLLEQALYNMALDEMINALEPDSTLRTGQSWGGVWTRDVSYSILLSMAYMQPRVSMHSLMRKVDSLGRIVQDTGTGGAWPCSTDRTIWIIAAWELYKVTGDEGWLQYIYPIVKRSLADDATTVFDPVTGLVKGESSFIDWREQSYPRWMESADIAESKCLGTNALYQRALDISADISERMGDGLAAKHYRRQAATLRKAINRYLWMPDKGYYAQYLYGRNYDQLSPRSETLGEALSVLWGVASPAQSREIASRVPVMPYGVPVFYPHLQDRPSYHNNASWPFVVAFWMHASAQAGNEAGVLHSIGSIYRAAAVFATNKENFIARDGDFHTELNSSNMLWSLSGNLSLTYRLLFGLQFETDGLHFRPFVPHALAGTRTLTNFPYRNARIDMKISGYGNRIRSFRIDGKEMDEYVVPTDLTGRHTVCIELSDKLMKLEPINLVPYAATLPEPVVWAEHDRLAWASIPGAVEYGIFKNGRQYGQTKDTAFLLDRQERGEFQVMAWDSSGMPSLAGEPIRFRPQELIWEVEEYATKADYPHKGYRGNGFVEISQTVNRKLDFEIEIPETGIYAIDWRYANGNGPLPSSNSCAIRTLRINGIESVVLFPHRCPDYEWYNQPREQAWWYWGWSNAVHVRLEKGRHRLTLKFLPSNENMAIRTNQAMLDQLRCTRID